MINKCLLTVIRSCPLEQSFNFNMRFDIIYLSLGLASVVYAFPVSQRVSVTTGPVTNQVCSTFLLFVKDSY